VGKRAASFALFRQGFDGLNHSSLMKHTVSLKKTLLETTTADSPFRSAAAAIIPRSIFFAKLIEAKTLYHLSEIEYGSLGGTSI